MGQDNTLKSFERMAEDALTLLNEEIKKMDWNKEWQDKYPKTVRAKLEMENLKRPEFQELLKNAFQDDSLFISKISEVL